jgi:hypothetical protein
MIDSLIQKSSFSLRMPRMKTTAFLMLSVGAFALHAEDIAAQIIGSWEGKIGTENARLDLTKKSFNLNVGDGSCEFSGSYKINSDDELIVRTHHIDYHYGTDAARSYCIDHARDFYVSINSDKDMNVGGLWSLSRLTKCWSVGG